MANLDYQQAADAIQGVFKTAWDALTPPLTGTVPPVEWDNLEPIAPPNAPWARVTVQHADGGQSSLGEAGNRLFDRSGVVTVQVFATRGEGLTLARALAKIARDAFEGNTAGSEEEVWFRNVRSNEVGPTDKWFQVNVTAEFQYDNLK